MSIGQIKRIIFDFIIFVVLIALYASQFYVNLSSATQLIFIKVLLVSMGFLHAHITRKLAFPKVDWQTEGINAKTLLVISLYVIFIYAYANAG